MQGHHGRIDRISFDPPPLPSIAGSSALTPIVQSSLARVLSDIDGLHASERRLAVFGAYKSGKSSLLNALSGTSMLPASAVESYPVVATLRKGDRTRVRAVAYPGGEVIDEADPAVFPSEIWSRAARSPESCVVEVQAPGRIPSGWTLVDTPGFSELPGRLQSVGESLAGVDLAVMVLAADKILSVGEREIAREANRLLGGSVLFAVNRMDLVDDSERHEVLRWVERALEGLGNPAIGEPRIFPTICRPDAVDLGSLPVRLNSLVSGAPADTLMALSRLARLRHSLTRLTATVAEQLEIVGVRLREARELDARELETERTRMRSEIADARVRLRACEADLPRHEDALVATVVNRVRSELESGATAPSIPWREYVGAYAEAVSTSVQERAGGAPAALPTFDLRGWMVRGQPAVSTHHATDAGAAMGDLAAQLLHDDALREHGVNLGRWVARNLFQTDVEGQTLKRAEAFARSVAAALHGEAKAYLERIDALLQDVDRYYSTWTRAESHTAELRDLMSGYLEFQTWTEDVLRRVSNLTQNLMSKPPCE